MTPFSRKEFLKTTAMAAGALAIAPGYKTPRAVIAMSFSTLGCPGWPFDKIVEFAVANGYRGIEIRGIQREMDLTKCKEFSPGARAATMQLMKDNDLVFVNLGSSANLHTLEPVERKKNLDEARRFIDLAHEINCPFIRVFPNNLPVDRDRQATLELIAQGLLELGEYARDSKVAVLMETHGDLVRSEDILNVMNRASHPNTGLVYDICNMWSVTKERPVDVVKKLKKFIRHTHFKDAKIVDGKPQYVLTGKGEVPIRDAMLALVMSGSYTGFIGFEWEKLWHPEIEEPEIAIADFPKAMEKLFQ